MSAAAVGPGLEQTNSKERWIALSYAAQCFWARSFFSGGTDPQRLRSAVVRGFGRGLD